MVLNRHEWMQKLWSKVVGKGDWNIGILDKICSSSASEQVLNPAPLDYIPNYQGRRRGVGRSFPRTSSAVPISL